MGVFSSRKYNLDGNNSPKPPFDLSKDAPLAAAVYDFVSVEYGPLKAIKNYGPNAHTLATQGAVTTKRTPFGSLSQSNDATVDAYSDTDNAYVALAYPFTIACWFIANDALGQQAPVSISQSGATNVQFGIIIDNGSGGGGDKLSALARNPPDTAFSTNNATTTVAVTTGVPHRALAVFKSATSRTIYLDGGNSVENTNNVTHPGSNLDNLAFGRLNDFSPNWELNGQVWGFVSWNRALSAIDAWRDFAPQSRWDLYYDLGRKSYYLPVVVVGGNPLASSLMTMGVGF